MFATKAAKDHVITATYNEEMVDFADKKGSRLDDWVFLEVEKFFENARSNKTLLGQLNSDKIVFFLHLLGLDVNGHGYRPHSQEYLNNINSVDSGIKRMMQIFERFYKNDNKTAYIMTSDHGMSDWGSHGSGHPDETLTPMVAWGAGIQGPRKHRGVYGKEKDSFSETWKLEDYERSDISQIDVAALMATLIGVPFPVNSLGVLPVSFLNESEQFKAENLFRNARQILAQYKQKQLTVKENSFYFRPFVLTGSLQEEFTRNISLLIRGKKFGDAMDVTRDLIQLAKGGLRYYHSHSTIYIAVCVTIGFIGWILLVVIETCKNYTDIDLPINRLRARLMPSKWLSVGFAVASLFTITGLMATSAKLNEFLYCLMLLAVFYQLSLDRWAAMKIFTAAVNRFSVFKLATLMAVFGVALSLLVAAFTYRAVLSFILLSFAVYPIVFRRTVTFYSLAWLIACLLLSIFPLLPTLGREENYAFVALAGLAIASSTLVFACNFATGTKNLTVMSLLVTAVVLCTLLRLHTSQSIAAKEGLPVVNQILSWALVPTLPTVVLFSQKESITRLIAILTSLLSIYLLTCISYEGFFVFILALTMILWIKVEQQLMEFPSSHIDLQNRSSSKLSSDHIRISFMFIFFILLAFFGTGNIASLNSFDPASVNSFITLFRPFVMASVFFIKILIPLLLVSCGFSAMQNTLHVQVRGLFYVVMVMTDVMSIMFFFLIKDEGSWQEIGTSITHFVIMLAFVIFLVPLFEIGYMFTGSVSFNVEKYHLN
ncbi:GPI ethanolamine phosphate transferase 1-like isoform X2 [Rhopilema esculentum]